MKVRDLIKMSIDIDVYDNVCEALSIAFCGPIELTDEGKAKFEIALNLDVEIDEENNVAIVNIEDEFFPDLWKYNLKAAKNFFYSAAGYCSGADWEKWFVDNDHTVEKSELIL